MLWLLGRLGPEKLWKTLPKCFKPLWSHYLSENQEGAGRRWKDGELDLLAPEGRGGQRWRSTQLALASGRTCNSFKGDQQRQALSPGKERDCAPEGPCTAAAPWQPGEWDAGGVELTKATDASVLGWRKWRLSADIISSSIGNRTATGPAVLPASSISINDHGGMSLEMRKAFRESYRTNRQTKSVEEQNLKTCLPVVFSSEAAEPEVDPGFCLTTRPCTLNSQWHPWCWCSGKLSGRCDF